MAHLIRFYTSLIDGKAALEYMRERKPPPVLAIHETADSKKLEIVFETRGNFLTNEEFIFLSYMANTSTDISKLLESQHAKLLSLMGQTVPLADVKGFSLAPVAPATYTEGKQGIAQRFLGELGDGDGEERWQQACREWAESVESLHVKAIAWQNIIAEMVNYREGTRVRGSARDWKHRYVKAEAWRNASTAMRLGHAYNLRSDDR
ncbi:MAG: hypothetical protein Q9212_003806 [Teloschistes hypoglaucus]